MSGLTKQILLIERVHQLIRLRATGSPKQLAKRLQISEATVFRIIETMKTLKAPIYYDWHQQSYAYSEPMIFRCGFYQMSFENRMGN